MGYKYGANDYGSGLYGFAATEVAGQLDVEVMIIGGDLGKSKALQGTLVVDDPVFSATLTAERLWIPIVPDIEDWIG